MVKTGKPLVSIIVPVYRVEEYIDECVASIVAQTYTNLEIILIDDASPDNSGDKCEEWAKKDNRIVVKHKSVNEGLNMARKSGFELSHGKYVTFLDSDDFFHKDNVKNSLQVLLESEAEVAVYASQEFKDADKKPNPLSNGEDYEIKRLTAKDEIAYYAFFGEGSLSDIQHMTVWGKMYARDIVERVDWEAANYRSYEDNFWTPQALLSSSRIVLMSNPLIYYRRNAAYGTDSNNLGNRLTGNTFNGKPVGYLELVELIRKFHRNLAHEHGFDAKLDKKIDEQAFLSRTWRFDNLAKANLLNAENNMEFTLPFLRDYIVAKNSHIDNLDAEIAYLKDSLQKAEQVIEALENNMASLERKLAEFIGVKRSAKLLAGNIKRRVTRF